MPLRLIYCKENDNIKLMSKEETKLTDRQAAFVQEYLLDLNATQAAIRAGYSENTASETGYENLRKPQIVVAIQKAFQKRAERTQLTADRILAEIMKLSFINPKSLFNEDGDLLSIHEMPDDVACAIAAIDVGEVKTYRDQDGKPEESHRVKKIKLWDKRGSLELLGKHLKLFTDKVEHSGSLYINPLDAVKKQLESNPELEGELKDNLSD